jgi:hypothetical protein
MSHNVEINCTLECNLACHGCNRLCGTFAPKEHMSVTMVERHILPLAEKGQIARVKLVGGEPLLWHDLEPGYTMLRKAHRDGLLKLVGNTNGTVPMPDWMRHDGIHWYTSPPSRKVHLPFFRAPADLGVDWSPLYCRVPKRCGFSLDARGWLPCSPAIMIVRVFQWLEMYRNDPHGWRPWGLEKMCGLCPHSGHPEWRRATCKRPADFTEEDKTPTKSWKWALEEYRNGDG